MSLKKWKKLQQVFEFKNPWWSYRKDEVVLHTGQRGEYHFVHVKGSSMIIPMRSDRKLILVNQYRYLLDRESLEFPCGSVKEGATYDKTAQLELAEETGLRASHLQCVAEFNPYNGVTDEMCRVYIAQELHPVNIMPEETEEFERMELSVDELEDKIISGEIWDGMTLAAWALVRPLPVFQELF